MATNLQRTLETHRVVVCVGSGGVGKTTTAAAIAVHAAASGRRTLCLTIDPARRLANSLGLDELTSTESVVSKELFARHGLACRGELFAMMLDPKETFDALVTSHAPDPASVRRILDNRFYQYISGSLAGTQEYMAMEKLYAVRKDARWDFIVLDTPPTANALDFLAAPERLVGAIDSPAMRWFASAFEAEGHLSLSTLGRGAAFLLRGLSRFTGAEFLDRVAEFVTGINSLFGGFRDRATRIAEALRSEEVGFVLVTSPDPLAIEEALYLRGRLDEAKMQTEAVVINYVHPTYTTKDAPDEALESVLAKHLPSDTDPARALRCLKRALSDERVLGHADRASIERLRRALSPEDTVIEVPAFEQDIHDLLGLSNLAAHLVGRTNGDASDKTAGHAPASTG